MENNDIFEKLLADAKQKINATNSILNNQKAEIEKFEKDAKQVNDVNLSVKSEKKGNKNILIALIGTGIIGAGIFFMKRGR